MNPETTIAELLRLWPRLPDLAGAHWPAMYWQLVDLLRAFRRAEDDQRPAGVAIGVQRLLASVPEAVDYRIGRLGERAGRILRRRCGNRAAVDVAGVHVVRTSQRARPFWQRLNAIPRAHGSISSTGELAEM